VVPLRRGLLLNAALGRSLVGVPLAQFGEIAEVDWGGARAPTLRLPPSWEWRKWRDVGTSQNGRAFASGDYATFGVRLLRPGNLTANGRIVWSQSATRYLPERYRESHSTRWLNDGDLVMNLTAQSLKDDFLGRVCTVRSGDGSLLNQRLARLVPHLISSDFALLVFQSPLFRTYVQSLNSGSLIQHMFTRQVAEFWLPIPPPDVQSAVVEALRSQLDMLERLVGTIAIAQSRQVVLRQGLLAAAFSGRLSGRRSEPGLIKELADV